MPQLHLTPCRLAAPRSCSRCRDGVRGLFGCCHCGPSHSTGLSLPRRAAALLSSGCPLPGESPPDTPPPHCSTAQPPLHPAQHLPEPHLRRPLIIHSASWARPVCTGLSPRVCPAEGPTAPTCSDPVVVSRGWPPPHPYTPASDALPCPALGSFFPLALALHTAPPPGPQTGTPTVLLILCPFPAARQPSPLLSLPRCSRELWGSTRVSGIFPFCPPGKQVSCPMARVRVGLSSAPSLAALACLLLAKQPCSSPPGPPK